MSEYTAKEVFDHLGIEDDRVSAKVYKVYWSDNQGSGYGTATFRTFDKAIAQVQDMRAIGLHAVIVPKYGSL